MIVTIDGYSCLGKSSIGRKLAEELNIDFLSTGVFVRFVASQYTIVVESETNNDAAMEKAVTIFENTTCEDIINYNQLYTKETEESLKIVSKYPSILPKLQKVLTQYVNEKNIVLDGRFTFSIFPEAHRKYYFQSTVANRARLVSRVNGVILEEAFKYINYRDSFEEKVIIPESVRIIDPFLVSKSELIQRLKEDVLYEE